MANCNLPVKVPRATRRRQLWYSLCLVSLLSSCGRGGRAVAAAGRVNVSTMEQFGAPFVYRRDADNNGAAAGSAPRPRRLPATPPCNSSIQLEVSNACNLNGVCEKGVCHCDPGWAGPSCSALDFDVGRTQQKFAYRQGHGANGSSWGAAVARDAAGTYHMFVSEWTHDCGLAYWTPNSRIVRAESSSPTGPFAIVEQVLPTFWTNPQIARGADGTWLLFADGMDCNRTVDCRNASATPPKRLPTCTVLGRTPPC